MNLDRFTDAWGHFPVAHPGVHPRQLHSRHAGREETIRSFEEVLDGKHDNLPEQAFYMVGNIDEVIAKAKELAK